MNETYLKSNLLSEINQIIAYIILSLILAYLILAWPIFGLWISVSLILAIWTKDDDSLFVKSILFLFIFGQFGRFLAPGTLIGFLWGFDPLIIFGLFYRLITFQLKIDFKNISLYFLLFSILGLLGSIFTFSLKAVLVGSLYSGRWLMYWLAINSLAGQGNSKKQPTLVKNQDLLQVGVLLSIIGFIQLLVLPAIPDTFVVRFAFDPHVYRLLSTWMDPNYLGGFLILVLLLNWSLLEKAFHLNPTQKSESTNKYLIISFSIILIAIILTFSRSTYLSLTIGIVVYYLLRIKNNQANFKLKSLVLSRKFAGTLLLVIIFVSLIKPIRERVFGALTLDITTKQRFQSWQRAFETIQISPILGLGYNLYDLGNLASGQLYETSSVKYNPAERGSDSSLLTIWATAGIGGLCIYLIILKKIWISKKAAGKAALASFLAHSFFVNSLLLPPFMLVFWLLYRNGHD